MNSCRVGSHLGHARGWPCRNDQRRDMGLVMRNAKEIIEAARTKLRELDEIENKFAADAYKRDNTFEPLVRDMPAHTTQPKEEPEMQMNDWSGWDAWAEQHVQQGLERAASILGDEVGKVEAKLLKRICEARGNGRRATRRQTVTRSAAEIIDLPDFRKKNDAARR